jgi:hypothetical protein
MIMTKKKSNAKPAGQPNNDEAKPGKKLTTEAHDRAEKDLEKDPELNSKTHREDDLDEGELARLERKD